MLRIDCLLLNTEVADTVRKIVGYLGHKGISEGKDVSFRSMYKELRKNGVEVDLETAAKIYSDELPLHDQRFTSEADLKYDTGHWFDDVVRALVLRKPKTGEKEIGELSPAQAVVKGIADAFSNNVRDDETTKSILKTLEDTYRKGAQRMLGEKSNKESAEDTRTTAEIVQEAVDKEALGYRNIKDGTINGIAKMHEEVRKEIAELTRQMEASGDHDKAEQWKNYAKSLEDASYTLMFSTAEGKKILNESLMDGGFVRTTKEGKRLLDWQKLAGNINSYEQLRQNVVEGLTKQGIPEDTAHRVADSMSKEFRDMRGKILETAVKKYERTADSWTDAERKVKDTLPETVEKNVKAWQNLIKFEGRENNPLKFNKKDAQRVVGDALKNSEQYGMDFGKDGRAIDWVNMSQEPPTQQAVQVMVEARLQEQGLSAETAALTAESVSADYHKVLMEDIASNAQRLLDNRQAALDRESGRSKSDYTRLAELHDLGVFNGAHDKLLAKLLGIEEHDRQAMNDVRQFAEQMSKLRHLMDGNDFLVPSMQREVAHQIHQIVARTVENKTRMLKVMSSLNKVYQLENSSLVSGYRNILENHLSGFQEYMTTKANMRIKLGDLAKSKKDLRQLMGDTWKAIAQGGNEFGLAPYQVTGNQLRISDEYNLNKMKDIDWKSAKGIAKGAASAILTVPRAFLSGTDGMFKTGLFRLHFLSGMHDALVRTGEYTHEQALAVLNDAFYGPGQLEKARIRAKELYDKSGINYVSKKDINITANELLHENLLQESVVTPEMIMEVQEAAFKMAGLGMGHESNNPVAKLMQSSKRHFNMAEQQAFNDGQYGKAASNRMLNTIINSVALRFAASQANWAWIKVEQSGVGIISGFTHYMMGKSIKVEDMFDTKRVQEQAEHYLKARQSAARGVLGLMVNAALTNLAIPALAKAIYGDDEDAVDELFENMGDNYLAKALFLKTVPIWGLADYYKHTTKSGAPSLSVTGDIISNVTGFGGTHNNATQFAEAIKYLHSPKENMNERGYAKLGSLLSNNLPHVPFYKTGKDVLQTAKYFSTGHQPMYNYPQNFMQGLYGGGVTEDVAPLIPRKWQPEWMEEWSGD